jgi:hypothetical protein
MDQALPDPGSGGVTGSSPLGSTLISRANRCLPYFDDAIALLPVVFLAFKAHG